MKLKTKKEPTLEDLLKSNHETIEEAYNEFAEIYFQYKLKELELNIMRDKLAEDMRKNPAKWNLEKGERITDALVNRIIVRDKKYQNLYTEYQLLKKDRIVGEGDVEAAKVKSYSLIELFKVKMPK